MTWIHLSDTFPIARKRYLCCLCERFITIGEKHTARRGIDDEGPATVRMHTDFELATKHWSPMEWETFDPLDFRHAMEQDCENQEKETT